MKSSGEDPAVIVHEDSPCNSETSPGALCRDFITPSGIFFSRNHAPFPKVDVQEFRLSVSGMVGRAVEFSMQDIKGMANSGSTVAATLQCAGNRREAMISVKDIPGETPWGLGAVGNAEWTGVPLRDVIEEAGVLDGAKYVAFESLDSISGDGPESRFGASIPLEKAIGAEVMLAYAMNGEALPEEHGGPLRVVVPGYTGARSVKWLSKVELRGTPSDNYYQAYDYRLYAPNITAECARPEEGIPLDESLINSAVCHPQDGAVLQGGPGIVSGYATAGGGRMVSRVDVSCDAGDTWTQARLCEGRDDPWTWTLWETEVELEAGSHEIVVRAVDSSANIQPQDAREIWNHRGYASNPWHRVRVDVR